MDTREMRQKRANLIQQARGVLDAAKGENRDLTQEEENRYSALMDDVNKLATQIEREERQEALERELGDSTSEPNLPDPQSGPGEQDRRVQEFQEKSRRALNAFLRDEHTSRQIHLRALQADQDIYGGYLVTPVQFVRDLIQAVDDAVFMRQWATTYQVAQADALGVPSLDTDPADPTWTAEIAVGSEDSSMAFGRRELHPHPLAKYIKVSRTLLRKAPSAEAIVRERLSYKFSVTMENAYLNGSGSNQPLGVFTASDSGISTDRDVSTGNATTAMTFDGLQEAKFKLKGQYWPTSRWLFHRDGVKQLAKIKDNDGRYIWQESVQVGQPDRLLGFPTFMSEYAPNTFTAGLYVGILGSFRYYWIADALDMELQRLDELYAATNQVGFIGRMESDGMPVLEEAFVRVKLATG